MSRVLVTGACGYIGRHVVKSLLERGHHVIAADVRDDGCDLRAEMCLCDIFSGDPELYQKLGSPEKLVHLAWLDGFVHNSPRHIEYLPLHYQFLDRMLSGGVEQVAVMGTMHEIGYHEGAIDEDTPAAPLSLYGIAKNSLRQACGVLQDRYPDAVFQWLRAYYICGDDAFNHSIFAKIAAAEREGKKTFPLNSGKNRYDFITVEELAWQIAAAVSQKEVCGVIDCCTGQATSLREKVERFIQERGFSIRPEYGAFPDRPYDSPGVWGDPAKIQEIVKRMSP